MSAIRWWIDIANAPHVAVFRPIVQELRRRGDDVVITTWDRGQTRDLASAEWPEALQVGTPGYKAALLAKGTAVVGRARELARRVVDHQPLIALGHNSYSQLLAAKSLKLGSITMMDYEHQPANHLAFRLADVILLPEIIPQSTLRRFGVHRGQLIRYRGIKEEIALAEFQPDPGFRTSMRLDVDGVVAVVRPAAEGALYHRHRNTLCDLAIERLVATGGIVLLSPRTEAQARRFSTTGIRILGSPVSGANLLHHADLVVGAGGTMTREAAVLGIPTFSIFEGRPAAIDQWLERVGRIRTIRSPWELPAAQRLPRLEPWSGRHEAVKQIVELLTGSSLEVLASRGRSGVHHPTSPTHPHGSSRRK